MLIPALLLAVSACSVKTEIETRDVRRRQIVGPRSGAVDQRLRVCQHTQLLRLVQRGQKGCKRGVAVDPGGAVRKVDLYRRHAGHREVTRVSQFDVS